MGVTSNYSFPVPVATDLVKNGWDAINDLGVAVDTAMNTALATKKAGMVLLNTTSFSAVSSQSLPTNTFTATYKNYLILIDVTTSASTQLNLRYRAAGVDATGSNYSNQWLRGVSTTASAASSGSNAFNDLETNAATRHLSELYLYQPQLAVETAYTNKFLGGSGAIGMIGGLHSLTTAYDSATFYPTTGTMTGNIYTYGVNF
jgi:hypothetical protein